MQTPRILHRLRAYLGGYFWAPCLLCGRYFGGHEPGCGKLWYARGVARLTCPDPLCREAVGYLNRTQAAPQAPGLQRRIANGLKARAELQRAEPHSVVNEPPRGPAPEGSSLTEREG